MPVKNKSKRLKNKLKPVKTIRNIVSTQLRSAEYEWITGLASTYKCKRSIIVRGLIRLGIAYGGLNYDAFKQGKY